MSENDNNNIDNYGAMIIKIKDNSCNSTNTCTDNIITK